VNGKTARAIRKASPGGRADYRRNKRAYGKVPGPQRAELKQAIASPVK